MEIDKAINILKDHNLWRRGSDKKKMATPEELGIAFVKVIAFAEETRASQLLQANVVKSLPTKGDNTEYWFDLVNWGSGGIEEVSNTNLIEFKKDIDLEIQRRLKK